MVKRVWSQKREDHHILGNVHMSRKEGRRSRRRKSLKYSAVFTELKISLKRDLNQILHTYVEL